MTASEASAAVRDYALAQVDGPYIYGATAQRCTISYRMARMAQYPQYEEQIMDSCPALSGEGVGCVGCKWDGRLAHDCAQLTRYAAQAAGLVLPSGATSQWDDADWAASGLIADMPSGVVCILYRRRDGRMVHTGIALGDGTVVEARSHADGVLRSDMADYPWTHWGILRGMLVPDGAGMMVRRPVLRKGAAGEVVKQLQVALLEAGYDVGDLGADGRFGGDTRSAVILLQREGGLDPDGIVGELTWARLDELVASGGVRYTVTVPGVTQVIARRIISAYGGEMRLDERVAGTEVDA